MNADYDILGSDLLQQSMNPSLVIPAPRHAVYKQQAHQVPVVEPKVILAPPPLPAPTQHQLQLENQVVFDEMQYLQPIDGKNHVEMLQTIDGANETSPKQRKIQIVKKLTAGPINEQPNLTLKVQKPTTAGETVMTTGTPFVINKVNGNISGAHVRNNCLHSVYLNVSFPLLFFRRHTQGDSCEERPE